MLLNKESVLFYLLPFVMMEMM